MLKSRADYMSVKYKIIITVSGIVLLTFLMGYYFVYTNFVVIVESDRARINNEMTSKWRVKGKEAINRYYKLLQIYEDIALNQAVFYAKDEKIIHAYNIAGKGNLNDSHDGSIKQARALIRNKFKGNLGGLAELKIFGKFRLHFYGKAMKRFAVVRLDDLQIGIGGKAVDIIDNISGLRNITKSVIENNGYISGVEIGREGLNVRGVCSINSPGDEYLGYVESIWPVSNVINTIVSEPDVHYAVYSYKDFWNFQKNLIIKKYIL